MKFTNPVGAPVSCDRAILDFIVRAGGATVNELAAGLGARTQTISARMTELRRAGLIKANGRTRRTPTGRKARVWIIKTKGKRKCSQPIHGPNVGWI